MTNKNITLNVWKNNNGFAMAVQGEVDSRFLTIKLEDDNGPVDLTEKTVKFLARKPDKNIIFNNMKIDDAVNGIATLELTSQMSAVPGLLNDCEVHIMSGSGETLIVKKINILIQPSLGDTLEESTSELTAFQKLVKDVTKLKAHSADKSNPHEVSATQIGALPTSTKYGASLSVDGTTVSLKDQNGANLSSIETQGTKYSAGTNVSISSSNVISATDTTYSVATKQTDGLMSTTDKVKIDGIESGAQANVQPDWNQTDTTSGDYIKNKPTIPSTLTSLSGVLPITQGGTGAKTARDAQANLQIYSSLGSLNLSNGCTTHDIIKALPDYSIFSFPVNDNTIITDIPSKWGQLTIIKSNYRKTILYNTSLTSGQNGNNFWFGEHNNSAVTWYKIFTSNPNCVVPIENGGTGATTAAAALTNLGAQAVTDNTLNTTNKTIVGAINEIYNMISGT